MQCHLEARVNPPVLLFCFVLFFFSLKTILIGALLITGNIASLVRKLHDSENSNRTKHVVF